ncbi:hypothetical protein PR048_024587 [Dryococelus australis]|uniref:Uncharacterized protein n=1 Tax=Dryococelus australis TaxID=614101 RepID=A0ABQ9GNZ3_9NEOP|nr:hypothetical protein PR048_024587 [Dryococelus australis]
MCPGMFQDVQNLSALRFTVTSLNYKNVRNFGECDVDFLSTEIHTHDIFSKTQPCNYSVAKHRLYLHDKAYVLGREFDKESISMKVANQSQPTELMQKLVHLKAA